MKKLTVFLLALIMCVLGGLTACNGSGKESSSSSDNNENKAVTASVRVMSINIAGQDMTESENVGTVKYPGQNGHDYTYAKRRARLDSIINECTPDVLYLQEVNGSKWWWPYLVTNEDSFVNTFTNYTLVGRTNRVGQSEGGGSWWGDLYNQLYYDNTKFDAIATGMFYLNIKRTEPFSKNWHESAKYSSDDNNTCVWAVLKDKKTGVSAVYASTHLKPCGSYLARKLTNYRQAVNLADGLYKIAEQYADDGGVLPIMVGGDYNMHTATVNNYSYPYLTQNAYYSDAIKIAEKSDKSGTARVWGKNKNATADDGSITDGYRIDMFLTQGVSVSKYQCLNGTFIEDANGVYYTSERIFDGGAYDLSDHLPIMMDVKVPLEGRTVRAPEKPDYLNKAFESDKIVTEGESSVSAKKIIFSANDLVEYFANAQYMQADAVYHPTYGAVIRLMATETCPNVYTYFDYDGLMKAKGLNSYEIGDFSKIRIVYKMAFEVASSEFVVSVLNEGDAVVSYGTNTTKLSNETAYNEKTFEIKKGDKANGKITDILFGTMAYSDDYSGTCGLLKGDCIYIKSIEFIA